MPYSTSPTPQYATAAMAASMADSPMAEELRESLSNKSAADLYEDELEWSFKFRAAQKQARLETKDKELLCQLLEDLEKTYRSHMLRLNTKTIVKDLEERCKYHPGLERKAQKSKFACAKA